MNPPGREELEAVLRRIIRQEVRRALEDLLPVEVWLYTYREAADQINMTKPSEHKLKPGDIRGWVDAGAIRAWRYRGKERVSWADVEWHFEWLRHTWEEREKDRLAREWQEGEREREQRERRELERKVQRNQRRRERRRAKRG